MWCILIRFGLSSRAGYVPCIIFKLGMMHKRCTLDCTTPMASKNTDLYLYFRDCTLTQKKTTKKKSSLLLLVTGVVWPQERTTCTCSTYHSPSIPLKFLSYLKSGLLSSSSEDPRTPWQARSTTFMSQKCVRSGEKLRTTGDARKWSSEEIPGPQDLRRPKGRKIVQCVNLAGCQKSLLLP